jgi:hypothetical protein
MKPIPASARLPQSETTIFTRSASSNEPQQHSVANTPLFRTLAKSTVSSKISGFAKPIVFCMIANNFLKIRPENVVFGLSPLTVTDKHIQGKA